MNDLRSGSYATPTPLDAAVHSLRAELRSSHRGRRDKIGNPPAAQPRDHAADRGQAGPNIARGQQAASPPPGMDVPADAGLDHYHMRFTDRQSNDGDAKAVARSSRIYAEVILGSIACVSVAAWAFRMLT